MDPSFSDMLAALPALRVRRRRPVGDDEEPATPRANVRRNLFAAFDAPDGPKTPAKLESRRPSRD